MLGPDGRIYLSPPDSVQSDIDAVGDAMRSGWLAPVGPDLLDFEKEMASYLGVGHAVGMSSGTAGLHLALKYLGVVPGDAVLVPTLTFAATAFAVTYIGAVPVFIDSEPFSWNMDPELLARAARETRDSGRRVAAIVPVDLYGSTANYDALLPWAEGQGIPVLEDAAEAVGSRHNESRAGSFGRAGVLSFNGNKIMTTSGGGMLVTDDAEMASKVRFWSTQSREPFPWYEHDEIGYNYRLSNILAALGRSQLARIEDTVRQRRKIREWYRGRLGGFDGVTVQNDPPWGTSNAWLTVVLFDARRYPDGAKIVREALEAVEIESRPIWKPMHLQPVFSASPRHLTGVSETLFRDGLCLPSGTAMDEGHIDRVCSVIIGILRR